METRERSRSGGIDRIPSSILVEEILQKLDLPSLCSISCVSSSLRSAASQAISLLSSLDISDISPDPGTLKNILPRCNSVQTLTVNCLRLDDIDIEPFLGPHLRELNLLRGALLTTQMIISIARKCPNLRALTLELATCSGACWKAWDNVSEMLSIKTCLESICLKIRDSECECWMYCFRWSNIECAKNFKSLKLEHVDSSAASFIVDSLSLLLTNSRSSLTSPQYPSCSTLQKLSLCLDLITDEIVVMIGMKLSWLVELILEDIPDKEPLMPFDLTDIGLQSLGSCHHLKSLSLARNRQYCPTSFKGVSDMGIFLLAEGCKGLESIRLCGFSKVSDAGFTSILQSYPDLKKFEIRNAPYLSDLAFHDLASAPCNLSELKIRSCNLITSETMKRFASCGNLELLDLSGCLSIEDQGLPSISSLHTLTTLDLAGAGVTDVGLSIIGRGTIPIKNLSLRGCQLVTDKGISQLLQGGGTICYTLSTLDLGQTGISDMAVHTIVRCPAVITELCIRRCVSVTDTAIEALGTRGSSLQKLDLFACSGLSFVSIGFLTKPLFRGLQWVGVGAANTSYEGNSDLLQIQAHRPWLTVCTRGCEMGCHDGWHCHARALSLQ